MKVAIISYHRADNYGSVLQAYALERAVETIGQTATHIDYHSSAQDRLYKMFEKPNSIMSVARNIHAFIFLNQLKKRRLGFAQFRKIYLQTTPDEYTEGSDLTLLNTEYDCFVAGSDQIWNTQCNDFTEAYLLDFVSDKRKCISYAASIGREYIEQDRKEMFKYRLSGFQKVSVRETTAKRELEAILNRDIEVVPDPVLLLSKEEWNSFATTRRIADDYILCYFIGNVPGMRQFAKTIHRQTGLPLVLVNINLRDLTLPGRRCYDTNPMEFVSLVKHAKYVCTNSYHAVLFSILFNVNFWVFTDLGKGSAKSRIEEITARFKLEDRVLNSNTALPIDILKDIDYSRKAEWLDSYVKVGYRFLRNAIGETR